MMKRQVSSVKCRVFSILIFFLLTMFGCQPKQEKEKISETIPVKVMRVKLQDLYLTLEYAGNIKAKEEVLAYPKVSGKIIRKVKEEGSPINKDEVIAYIDRDEVGLKFENAPVLSPLTGIVGRVYVDIGQNVSQETPVALVVDMDKVKVDLYVPEKYLPQVSLRQKAQINVDAYPEEEFSGEVTKISPVVDLITRSALIELTIDNPEHLLKSGMFAKVKLILEEYESVPVILKEAVMGKEPDVYVYAIQDNKAILKRIILGIRQGPYYQVQEGLKEGELVVIMGQQRLRDNAIVSVEIETEEENKN